MKEQTISKITLIINSSLFLMLGIILIIIPTKSLAFFHLTISIIIIILGIISALLNIIRKKHMQNTIISILLFAMGIYFLYNPINFLVIFPIIFGLYIALTGTIKLITFLLYKINKFRGFVRIFLNGILDLLFSFLIIINPTKSLKLLTYILGFYFILFAFNYYIDFLDETFPNNYLTRQRRFRITIPNFLSIFIPYTFYTKINKKLNEEITNVKINKKVSGKVDLEIFIGVKDSNIGKFGHADLYFENKIYSFGHYDEESKKMFDTVGDGTLFIVNNKMRYLRFCTEHSKKTIFAFGITLTNAQKQQVREELNKIKSNTYRWKCLQETDKTKEYSDYASCLYRATKAKFYKFSKSTYKLYFVFWTNCVKLIDRVLGATGSDILRLNGFITPGAYYYHLNNEFKRKNSNVIKKEIITNKEIITQSKNSH